MTGERQSGHQWRGAGNAGPVGPQSPRLLSDAVFRHRPRGPRRRRHHAPRQPQRDLRACRRVELRQDLVRQDHRRRQSPAAQCHWRVGAVQLSRPRYLQAERGGAVPAPLEAPVVHHAGLDERPQSGSPDPQVLRRLRLPTHRPARARVLRHRRAPPRPAPSVTRDSQGLSARVVRRHAPARDHRTGDDMSARVHYRRRADHRPRRRGAEGRAGDDPRGAAGDRLLDPLRHARHDGPRQHGRPPRHHVRRPAGRGGADPRDLRQSPPPLHRASHPEPAADRRPQPQEGPARRPAEPLRAAARLPVPPALPARHGHLPAREPGAHHARARPSRRLLRRQPRGSADGQRDDAPARTRVVQPLETRQ